MVPPTGRRFTAFCHILVCRVKQRGPADESEILMPDLAQR
jgi:hypothetical protein